MRTDPRRFDRVEEHPEYATTPAQPVLPADSAIGVAAVAGPLVLSLFGAVFVLIALSLLLTIKPPLFISLLFIAGGVVFVFGGIVIARSLVAIRDAPIERMIAVIVKERTDVTSSENTTDTSYYATLQTRDGARTEYRVSKALVGRLVVDDIGVAYVKDVTIHLAFTTLRTRSLVEFIRFEVS